MPLRPRPSRAPCYPLGGRPARAAHRMRSWAGGVLPAGGVAAPGNPVRPGGAVPGRLPRGRERERCQGASGVSRTNHGTDEVRYEHLASGRDSAVTPRPWDHSGALARLWLESLVRPRTRLKRCRAWLPIRCWCSPSCARCSTTVCSRIDRRRVTWDQTHPHRQRCVTTLVLRPSVPLADRH